jgi:N-acetylmuramoyl-L-alanine amidase
MAQRSFPLRALLATALLTVALTATGCGSLPAPRAEPAPASSPAPTSTTQPAKSAPRTANSPAPTAKPATPQANSGKVVVLDPGHNGGNAAHPEVINAPVPAGRGVTKPCNTTGTSTDAGYQEHEFTFDVTKRAAALLRSIGVRVILTRPNDTGVGPCVNTRAAIGNRAHADAVISIHADGSTSAGARGFHVAYSAPPLNPAQGAPAMRLAETLRDGLTAGGVPISNYLGVNGLDGRDDLAGLNLSTRPSALVECGNMRDPAEAAAFTSPRGRQHYATAIANGIVRFLSG